MDFSNDNDHDDSCDVMEMSSSSDSDDVGCRLGEQMARMGAHDAIDDYIERLTSKPNRFTYAEQQPSSQSDHHTLTVSQKHGNSKCDSKNNSQKAKAHEAIRTSQIVDWEPHSSVDVDSEQDVLRKHKKTLSRKGIFSRLLRRGNPNTDKRIEIENQSDDVKQTNTRKSHSKMKSKLKNTREQTSNVPESEEISKVPKGSEHRPKAKARSPPIHDNTDSASSSRIASSKSGKSRNSSDGSREETVDAQAHVRVILSGVTPLELNHLSDAIDDAKSDESGDTTSLSSSHLSQAEETGLKPKTTLRSIGRNASDTESVDEHQIKSTKRNRFLRRLGIHKNEVERIHIKAEPLGGVSDVNECWKI